MEIVQTYSMNRGQQIVYQLGNLRAVFHRGGSAEQHELIDGKWWVLPANRDTILALRAAVELMLATDKEEEEDGEEEQIGQGTTKEAVLASLRFYAENVDTRANGEQWGEVYLQNIIGEGTNKHQIAGFLSVLKDEGLYKPGEHSDGFFGAVKF